MKPRLSYSAVFGPLNVKSLEYEKTELLLDGKPCVYAGSHYDVFIWLRQGSKVTRYEQAQVLTRLKLAPSHD